MAAALSPALLETVPGPCRPAQSQFRTISRQCCARGKKMPRYPYDNRARPNCQVPDRLVLLGTVAVRNPLHAFDLIGPPEKSHQIPPFTPEKSHDVSRLKAFGLLAGISLDAPLKIFAAPGPQAMATGRIPDKAKRSKHHHDDTSRLRPKDDRYATACARCPDFGVNFLR